MLHGVAYVERLAFDVLAGLGADTTGQVTFAGGAVRNQWWNQLRSDLLQRPVLVPEQVEAAVGSAVVAAAPAGRLAETAARMVRVRERLEPDPRRASSFRGLPPAGRRAGRAGLARHAPEHAPGGGTAHDGDRTAARVPRRRPRGVEPVAARPDAVARREPLLRHERRRAHDGGAQQADPLAAWAAARPGPTPWCARRCAGAARRQPPAAAALGAGPVVVDDLREMHFGLAEGRTLDEVEAEHPGTVDAFRGDPVAHAFPGSEPPARRPSGWPQPCVRSPPATPGPTCWWWPTTPPCGSRCACCWASSCRHYRRVFPRIDNGALTRLRVPTTDDPPGLLGLNIPLDGTTEDLR